MTCPQCNTVNPDFAESCSTCGTPMPISDDVTIRVVDTSALEPGSDFGPRYRIESLLGQGGMGRVYKAYDKTLDRVVAIKVVREGMVGEAGTALQRFKQELLLASKISHKNVLRIHDMGEVGPVKFISMAYVEGPDLYHILRDNPKLPLERALSFSQQLAEALAAAHGEGVIHRDLKPQNILVDKDDHIYVSDFGLAKSFQDDSVGMTRSGAFLGTPRYMSPEQVEGNPADQRSDLYAYGLILYEMVAGNVPFTGESTLKVMYQRLQETPKSPRLLNPSIPAWFDTVIMRCLEKDPAVRYQTATEILADLQAAKPSASASRAGISRMGSRTVQIQIPHFAERRWTWIAAALAVILLATAAFVFRGRLFSGGGAKRSATGPAVSLLILPFRNASGEDSLNWLGPGMAEMLTTDVGESSTVRIVSADRLHQILSDLHISSNVELDQGTVRQIADFTTADRIVSGEYAKLGDEIQVNATLQDLKQQRSVSLKAKASSEKDVLQAVHELAKLIQENLALPSGSVQELQAAAFTPSSKSVDALKDYSQGLELGRQGNNLDALKQFQDATKVDPTFAFAYSKLAQTYSSLGYDGDAVQASQKAMDLSDNLPAQEKYRIQAVDARVSNNLPKAIQAYEALLKMAPNDSDVQFRLADAYKSAGQYDRARELYSSLLAHDPKYVDALVGLSGVDILIVNPQGALDSLNRAFSLAVEMGSDEEKATILFQQGVTYKLMNKLNDALNSYTSSLDIRQRLGDKRGIGLTLNTIAQVQDLMGKSDEALKSYQDALKIRREIGDKRGTGATMIDLGYFYEARGHFDEALSLYKDSLQIQHETGEPVYEALCLNNIGWVYLDKSDYDDATTYFQQALDLNEKLKIPADIANTLYNLADTSTRVGKYDQALPNFLRALELWRGANDKRGIAYASYGMGILFEYQGKYGAALSSTQDAVNNFRQLQDRSFWMAEMLGGYGSALVLIGKGDDAQKALDEGLSLARDLKNNTLSAKLLDYEGDRLFYQGDYKGAQPLYTKALQLASQSADRQLLLTTKSNIAKVAVKEGRSNEAIVALKGLIKDADSLRLQFLSAQDTIFLGEALMEAKNAPQARQELESGLHAAEGLGARALQVNAHYLLGVTLRAQGNSAEASHHFDQARSIAEDIHKEAGTDEVIKRSDLKLAYAASR